MLDPDGLNVWHEHRLFGYLWRNAVGYIGFRYDNDWLEAGGFAISRTLPLTTDEYSPDVGIAHRFFANLLPEGGVRDRIIRDLKIPSSDFELLRAIGGECAGALTLLSVERIPSAKRHYHELSDNELSKLVATRGQISALGPLSEPPRLSLAGAQDKCALLFQGDKYFLPEGEAPSSHILKFELADHRHLPAYETFTTRLAGRIDLPTVEMTLCKTEKQFFARIARYDRVVNEQGDIQRLHQEDFCQAMDYGYDKKYQDAGGPSFADCYRLVQEASTDPAIDAQTLLRWQIFNVLAGNSDGHAKNLSFLYLPTGEIRLAPFYDLVCTRAITRIDHRLALDVGGERDPGQIAKTHWHSLAEQCDVKPQFLGKLVRETAAQLLEELVPARKAFEEQFGTYPALQRVERIVTRQCQRAINA